MLPLLLGVLACSSSAEDDTGAPAPDRSFDYPLDDLLRISHAQAKGTHNSYHVAPETVLVAEWGYSHLPLDEQARDQGVRQFELDVHVDPEGGDLTVFHAPVVDEESTCATLGDCLGALRAWSEDNPAHLPVVVLVEPKDDGDSEKFEGRLDLIDRSVAAAWPAAATFTPDDLQGDRSSLSEAVAEDGWPTLGALRGAAIFVLLDRGAYRDEYSAGQNSLAGRTLFALCDEDQPCASFFLEDDPVPDAETIRSLALRGYLVRTRADSGSEEAWAGDTSRQETALAAGAHYISTDYPGPTDEVDYQLTIPGGTPARCNPVTAPPECTSEDLENPEFMR